MGLICALDLLKAGHEVDVYERDDRIGGMSAHFDFDGLAIERYYHFICKTDYPLFDLLAELNLSDRLHWTDTKMGFYWNGRLYKWGTPQALLRFDGLRLIEKLRYALQVMKTKSVKDWTALDKIGALPWLKSWLGERAYKVLWERLFYLKFYELSNSSQRRGSAPASSAWRCRGETCSMNRSATSTAARSRCSMHCARASRDSAAAFICVRASTG